MYDILCMHVCMYVLCTCVCMYYVCVYVCMYVCVYVLCMYVCVYVCMYVCTTRSKKFQSTMIFFIPSFAPLSKTLTIDASCVPCTKTMKTGSTKDVVYTRVCRSVYRISEYLQPISNKFGIADKH